MSEIKPRRRSTLSSSSSSRRTMTSRNSLELDEEEDIIDEEEFAIIKKLKDAKKLYRENFDNFKRNKVDCLQVQNLIDQLKENLIMSFEAWYDENFDQPKEAQVPVINDFTDE